MGDHLHARPEAPRAVHPLCFLVDHLGLALESVRPALDYPADDARLLQNLEVLGDRRLGHLEVTGDFTDGCRTGGEAFDNPAADRIRESLEWIVNHLVNDNEEITSAS